jgi:HK97 family phage major capsid protein
MHRSLFALMAMALMSAPLLDPPRPVGYRKDGRPIYPIGGGDGTTDQIKALVEEIQTHWAAFQAESRTALDEIKARGEVSPETTLRVDELGQKVANVQAALAEIEASAGRPRAGAGSGLSLGRQFVDSEQFQGWLKANARNGRIPDGIPINAPPVPMPGPFALLPDRYRAALLTGGSATSAGALITPSDPGILVPFGMRDLTVLDLITMGATDSDSVDYVRVTAQTNNAAGVAESTATADPSPMDAAHGVKPESDMALERVNAPVQTIAHWIAVTKRALADAGQLRTMIDAFLRSGVREELENQVINGSGTGEEIEGFETSITLDQAYSATLSGSGLDPLLETTRKAITKVILAHSRPTAFLFHPNDWEKIELARMAKNPQNEGTGGGVPTLHGRPVAQNEEVTPGIGYVGDFRQYVVWDREQASIAVSNSHANFFIRNLVALLGELRAAGGLLKTDAICRIDLTA